MRGTVADSMLGVIHCQAEPDNTPAEGADQGAKTLSEQEDTA